MSRTPEREAVTPQEMAACRFMAHKGYPGVRPNQVDEVEGQDCWYFQFVLPEGTLELEVEYTERGWCVRVMDFVDRP